MSLAIMLSRFFQTARLHSLEIFSPIVGLFLVCYLFSIGTISAMSLLVLAIAAVAVFGFTSIVLLRNDLKMASLDERSNITDTPLTVPKLAPLVLAAFFATTTTIGRMLDRTGHIEWAASTAIKIIAYSAIILPILSLLFAWLDFHQDSKVARKANSEVRLSAPSKSRRLFWAACILIPQLFLFLVCYPGIYGYDGPFHIWQLIHSDGAAVVLNKGYSVPYTFYLSLFVSIGKAIGNVEFGFAMAMLIQMLFLCWVSWRICSFLYIRMPKARLFNNAALLFLALCPPILALRISSCQDAPCAGFFCLAIMQLIVIGDEAHHKIDVKAAISLAMSLLLTFLLRNNATYAYLFLLIAVLFLTARHMASKQVALWLVIPFVTAQIIMGPVYTALGIEQGMANPALREILSVPSQQLARAYADRPELFSEDQLDDLLSFYPDQEQFTEYWMEPELADRAKRSLDVDYTSAHLLKFLELYISVGLLNPEDYIEGFLMNSLGYWYLGKTYPDTRMYHPYFEYNNIDALWWNPDYTPIERQSVLPQVNQLISDAIYRGAWNRIPIISPLCRAGFYFAVFVGVCIFSLHARNKRNLLPLIFIGGLFVTLFLSPVCLFRYVFGISMATPLILSLLTPLQCRPLVSKAAS
ncbi:MAG: DUF6020 family protein [Collinsella sp.]|nr:DUF6020 family protein [Collinsella sp.]